MTYLPGSVDLEDKRNEADLQCFLRALTARLPRPRPVHIAKEDLLQNIRSWCNSQERSEVLLGDLESKLRKTVLIDDWAVLYNIYSERLVVEHLPTDGQVARSAELRSGNIRNSLRDTLRALSPQAFENLLANVFSRVPWARDVKTTKTTRDGGVDFVGKYVYELGDEVPMYGQAKHWRSRLDSPHVRSFIGALTTQSRGRPVVGIIYCTAGYSRDADSEIRRSPIKILQYNENRLVDLMMQYEVGVRRMQIESYSLDGRFWDEIKE